MALPGDYIIFSSNPTIGGVPHFELVLTNGNTELAVHIPGTGNLTSALTALTPGAVHQLGVRHWDSGAEYHWEYIIDGVVEAGTGPTISSLTPISVNVLAIGSDRGIAPLVGGAPSMPGRYDEILFWAAGNTLTDDDIKDIYDSYHYWPFVEGWDDELWSTASGVSLVPHLPTTGWDDELWGTPVCTRDAERNPITFVSCKPCTTFVSESPCSYTSCATDC